MNQCGGNRSFLGGSFPVALFFSRQHHEKGACLGEGPALVPLSNPNLGQTALPTFHFTMVKMKK